MEKCHPPVQHRKPERLHRRGSGYDEFNKEELTIGGYDALKATYLDEWGDAAESVYIEFGSDANTYLAILINVSAYTKEQLDSEEVQNIINSIQVN